MDDSYSNVYIPKCPDIVRDIRDHNSVINELKSRFGDKQEQLNRFIDLQIKILCGHKRLTNNRRIKARCGKTIDYWERRRTDPEATWDIRAVHNGHPY